jgi:flagellar hook-associated protein 3 FlgL
VNVRVTGQAQTNNAIAYMRQRNAELAKYQDQISSGVQLAKPSDDPAAFPALSQVKAASDRLGAYTQNISDSTAVLNSGVSALQTVNDLLVQAKQLALEGSDAATSTDPTSLEALATQVDGIINQTLQTANSQPDGKAIFGGTAINAQPFTVAAADAQGRPLTIAYGGADQRTRTLTGPEQTVDTRYAGSDVFQKPGADVFQALITLRDNLRSTTLTGPARAAAFQQSLTDLDAARNGIGDVTAEQSANLATLQTVQNLTGAHKLTADERVGELQGTDYPTAIVKMQEQQSVLQAIYSTTSKLLQPGLLSFIQ